MNQPKMPRIGLRLSNTVYIPIVKSYVPNKLFKTSTYNCIVYKDCENFDPDEYEYLYIMFAYRQQEKGKPCFAVASSTNFFIKQMKAEGNSMSGSHTLGVFPCDGKHQHLNLGISDEWADFGKFSAKAISIFHEHLSPSETAQEVILSEDAKHRLPFISESDLNPKQEKKPSWKFWQK